MTNYLERRQRKAKNSATFAIIGAIGFILGLASPNLTTDPVVMVGFTLSTIGMILCLLAYSAHKAVLEDIRTTP